jgi:EAL and modified HD-GYP domain-containing signal transduction protein
VTAVEVYVARQPIFDKAMDIVGYELLYRRSMNNFFEGADDNQATADLINSAFLVMQFNELTSGTRAFINFSADMLIKEIPLLLPKGYIVVEILEKVDATSEVLKACEKLKAEGYMIALDDFTFKESNMPLLELADIVKVEFSNVDVQVQRRYIQQYGDRIKFLAEKVETREEYQLAASMGYHYFQGYFFSRPVIEKSKEIASMPAALLRLVQEINQPEPDYQPLTEIIETDVGLSYKLLKFAGSVFFGTRGDVFTVKQALIRLGMNEIRKWVYLLMLKNLQSAENKELVKTCLIRAKFTELLALEAGGVESIIIIFWRVFFPPLMCFWSAIWKRQ